MVSRRVAWLGLQSRDPMAGTIPTPLPESPSPLDRLLRAFGDVRPGEGARVLLMFANIFALLVAYYIIKTVREPLILQAGGAGMSGAELKTYAAAAQALTLIAYVPLYGLVASRLPRLKLIVVVVLFFVGCVELFSFAGRARLPFVGFVFYVWVGIFSLTMIAQFWSYANDIYSRGDGERLFPLIAIGSTAGAPIGAFVAGRLFAARLSPYLMMQISAGLLLVHLVLYLLVARRPTAGGSAPPSPGAPLEGRGGFSLVARSRYLLLFAGMLVVLNVVNTTGEYILDTYLQTKAAQVVAAAVATEPTLGPDAQRELAQSFIGQFKGDYFLGFNVLAVLLQAFAVSRLVKAAGIAGAVLALPLVALGSYGFAGLGVGLAVIRWAKTAENATDYSVMNTGRQMLWLSTTREEKYKAKQAIDTFFVRGGDMLAAAVVWAGTHGLGLDATGFARVNLLLVALWIGFALALLRDNRRLSEPGRSITPS